MLAVNRPFVVVFGMPLPGIVHRPQRPRYVLTGRSIDVPGISAKLGFHSAQRFGSLAMRHILKYFPHGACIRHKGTEIVDER